ncbi:efflux RND transporter permease subunit [Methylacidimicrobium tartarophylax]|uniref:Multidrug resistance protein MdtC n=1 Tax=Methylacidimicrobium tartarophylax TaxID=1041768 RepID=A0A5E6MI57_9BACT|nr:efflux RND transporter permease subunit [Methylacidimicrobium tartarophylax]VVM08018.1 Multidrug resistance protein MdtC [Methylacidimicrobium tartarophylax]
MWLVRTALKKPYSVAVLAILILFLGFFSVQKTPTDIFPEIDIPVVIVAWQYLGLVPTDMTNYITTYSDYQIANFVDGVKRVESNAFFGFSVTKVYFQPNVDIPMSVAEITAVLQPIIKRMPPGTTPPLIFRFNASSVPVVQIAVSSPVLSESKLYDYTVWQLRRDLLAVRGTLLAPPWGGIVRWMTVNCDPNQLLARGLTAQDLLNVVNSQVIDYPSGDVKIGDRDYLVTLNNVPKDVFEVNNFPVKLVPDPNTSTVRKNVNDRVVYVRDVANVQDGGVPQWNLVRLNGRHGVLMTALKTGRGSTIQIVDQIKELLPEIRRANPKIEIRELFDQSVYVKAAIKGVLSEAGSAALLTGAMIFLFLGSFRTTLIVLTSIPLCILVALFVLGSLGNTLNLMTLGGLALAVGILVDDATVAIENIHRNLQLGKPFRQAILDGSQEIAAPAFMATLSISVVFTSVIFLEGPPRFLFIPMALAVVFSMLFSYFLSRTLVPAMAVLLLRGESEGAKEERNSILERFNERFNRAFDAFRERYARILGFFLAHRRRVFEIAGILLLASLVAALWVGRDFFPVADAGIMRLHVYAPTGTRIEVTETIFADVEKTIREVIPPEEVQTIVDNMGLPIYFMATLALSDSMNEGVFDGEIMIQLQERHRPTAQYAKRLRELLPQRFPSCEFFFQPADMVNEVLNFGIAAPIDIHVSGLDLNLAYQFAREIRDRIRSVPGAVDVHIHQRIDYPTLHLEVDRVRAIEMGLKQVDISNNVLNNLSSSFMVSPTYWVDTRTTINYPFLVFTPQRRISSINDLLNMTLAPTTTGTVPFPESTQTLLGNVQNAELLANVVQLKEESQPAMMSRSTMKPVFDVLANAQGRDLAGVAGDVERILRDVRQKLPPLYRAEVMGQVVSMHDAFAQLGFGVLFAIALVYLLLVTNFQSWREPFIILSVLPIGACGIIWMLFLTGTTFSVPALMGALMTVGVASSNSILLITFANQRMAEGLTAASAAVEAGRIRLRPVLMTAGAMIVGMLPMALGVAEGGEQYAPLGRAVIGGLLLATVGTLFFVPAVFASIRSRGAARGR